MIDHAAFIRANTSVLAPPLVPEVLLHLAHEAVPLWQKTEEELGEMGLPPPFWAFAWAGGQALARYVLDHPEIVAWQAGSRSRFGLRPRRHRGDESRCRLGAGGGYRCICGGGYRRSMRN